MSSKWNSKGRTSIIANSKIRHMMMAVINQAMQYLRRRKSSGKSNRFRRQAILLQTACEIDGKMELAETTTANED